MSQQGKHQIQSLHVRHLGLVMNWLGSKGMHNPTPLALLPTALTASLLGLGSTSHLQLSLEDNLSSLVAPGLGSPWQLRLLLQSFT